MNLVEAKKPRIIFSPCSEELEAKIDKNHKALAQWSPATSSLLFQLSEPQNLNKIVSNKQLAAKTLQFLHSAQQQKSFCQQALIVVKALAEKGFFKGLGKSIEIVIIPKECSLIVPAAVQISLNEILVNFHSPFLAGIIKTVGERNRFIIPGSIGELRDRSLQTALENLKQYIEENKLPQDTIPCIELWKVRHYFQTIVLESSIQAYIIQTIVNNPPKDLPSLQKILNAIDKHCPTFVGVDIQGQLRRTAMINYCQAQGKKAQLTEDEQYFKT